MSIAGFPLEGKVTWVSGASGDLGAAIARRFATCGALVVLAGRNADKLKEVKESIGSAFAEQVTSERLDIRSAGDVAACSNAIIRRFGHIDILVNSTSVSRFGDFLDLGDDAWLDVYEAKLFAYVRTIRAVLPHMIERGEGAIVNISGSGAKLPQIPSHVPGSTANAAVNTLTKSVADMYAKHRVRANCVAPGPIRTQRWTALANANTGAARSDEFPYLRKTLGEVDDVANAVAFLSSSLASHINGTVLVVDGGATPTVA